MNFAFLLEIQGNSGPFSRYQHRTHHFLCLLSRTSTKSHLFFRVPLRGSRNPLTHSAPLPNRLEHPISCASSSHPHSHRACTMISMVDVRSCALGVRWQSVGLCHECSSPAHSRHRIPSLRPPCPHPSVSPLNSNVIPIAFHTQRTVALRLALTMLTKMRSYGFSSLRPVFHAHCSAVECNSHPSLSSFCNLNDYVNLHGLVLGWRGCT